MSLFFSENRERSIKFKIDKILYDDFSDFQRITVFESKESGKILVLDGCLMFAEYDEFFYHEMIVHPVFSVSSIKKVLIIGGGDGGTLREVLKYSEVEKIKLVEIDKKVVEVAKKFLDMEKYFNNEKVSVSFDDGFNYIKNTDEKFDIVIVDSSDPVDFGSVLFSSDFVNKIRRVMDNHGAVVMQSESPFFNRKDMVSLLKNIKNNFLHSGLYWTVVPSYPGSIWTFAYGADFDMSVPQREPPPGLKFYTKDIHRSAFKLPPFIRDIVR